MNLSLFPRSLLIRKLIERRAEVFGIAVLLLVAAVSLALTLQGWRSRVPAFDLLTYIHGIRDFLATGALLQHGDTGSYGSYKPPGTAWLMLPSTVLFADPRLSEYVGTAFLHISALVAVYLLARRYFGLWCAYLAVPLYGLSSHGIFLAGSLWPNGRPDFYVWMAFFTSQWVVKKKAKYLAAALAIWGIGMHVDMGVTPAFFLIPAVWLYYRPPVHLKPLLAAGALVLIVWSPYLRLEASRGFADIRSQLLQQNIFPGNERETWCDQNLTLWTLVATSSTSQTSAAQTGTSTTGGFARLLSAGGTAKEKIMSNFETVSTIPGAGYILLLLTLSGLLILSAPGAPGTAGVMPARPADTVASPTRSYGPRQKLPQRIATIMVLGGALALAFNAIANNFGRDLGFPAPISPSVYKIGKLLLLSGAAMLAGPWLATNTNRLFIRLGVHVQTSEMAERTKLLVLILLVPWHILLIVAEPGKPERYWWLWPLQSIFLAAFLINVLPRFRVPRRAIWITQALVILVIAANSFLLNRVDSWSKDGWAGQDANEIQVADYLASQLEAEGKDRAAIGYNTFIYPFMASYNVTNPIYKVGAEFDLLLRYRHNVVNTNQCAEGVAADDEYRVVETRPKPPDWSPRDYFLAPATGDYHLLAQIGTYQVYGRD